jgi:hypothetical protein
MMQPSPSNGIGTKTMSFRRRDPSSSSDIDRENRIARILNLRYCEGVRTV